MSRKGKISEMERGAGFFQGFVTAFMDAAREKGVPFEAIHRLGSDEGKKTVAGLVEIAYEDWKDEQQRIQFEKSKPNGNPSFSAPIVYVQPEFEELKRRFTGFVNLECKGKRFDPIERCEAVSKENREVAFEYVQIGRNATTDEVLTKMDRRGLRPALYEELLGFAEKYPDEQRKSCIVALGSVVSVRECSVAFIWDNDDDGRSLGFAPVFCEWNGRYRFLAVYKGESKVSASHGGQRSGSYPAVESPGEVEYLAHVDYAPLPSIAELEKEFENGYVANSFDGRAFCKHTSCASIDETPGDRVFLVKNFNRDIKLEDVIVEMDKQGYRPATHLEAYAFQRAYPKVQRKFWIMAPGSFVAGFDNSCVAMLGCSDGCRDFTINSFGNERQPGDRFLFVRKEVQS
jgi:hypothetical protein